MQTQPLSQTREAPTRPSPVEIWQRLLSHLLDRHGFSAASQSPLISSIDILRARKATGLMTRNDYRTVTDITTGKYREVQP